MEQGKIKLKITYNFDRGHDDGDGMIMVVVVIMKVMIMIETIIIMSQQFSWFTKEHGSLTKHVLFIIHNFAKTF